MGREVVVAITNGRFDFGPWEQIFYGEFDGSCRKRVLVKIVAVRERVAARARYRCGYCQVQQSAGDIRMHYLGEIIDRAPDRPTASHLAALPHKAK